MSEEGGWKFPRQGEFKLNVDDAVTPGRRSFVGIELVLGTVIGWLLLHVLNMKMGTMMLSTKG